MPQQAGSGSLMPFPFILEKTNLNHNILCQTQGVRKNLSKYHDLNSNIKFYSDTFFKNVSRCSLSDYES